MAAASPPRVGLLYDERMCAHATPDGEEHPENPERLRAIWRKLNAEGITSSCVVLKAKEAEDKYIASVHSQDHVKLMKEISSKKYDSNRSKISSKYNSIYFNEGSSESAVLAAGSVIEVAEKVAAGELSSAIALVRPPGHHAEHGKAMGFCLFNNVAVAASYLLNERPDLGIKKILIVDWDVHHGNATQKMFYSDPRVLSFSVHRFDRGNFYPYKADASYCFIGEEAGKGYNINVPWEHAQCGDADYLAAWDHILLPVTEAFGPDIILVSAGFDAALGDPLGGCCVTPDGYALLLTKLLGFSQGRTVMALEGGYNLMSTANSVFACAKVLLGDKFKFNTLEKLPFESTWRVIRAVRNELMTHWPVLSGKLPETLSQAAKVVEQSSAATATPRAERRHSATPASEKSSVVETRTMGSGEKSAAPGLKKTPPIVKEQKILMRKLRKATETASVGEQGVQTPASTTHATDQAAATPTTPGAPTQKNPDSVPAESRAGNQPETNNPAADARVLDSSEVSPRSNAPEIAPTPPPEEPPVVGEIGANSMSAPVEEEIPEIHRGTQIGVTIDPDAMEGDFQMGFVKRERDGQAHNVTYDTAADEENIRLAMHYGAQFNSCFKAVIEDSQKKSVCLRQMTSAYNKAQRLQELLMEKLKLREVDTATIQSLRAQIESLNSENAALKNTVSKSREQIASATKQIKTLEDDRNHMRNEVYRKESAREQLAKELEAETKLRKDTEITLVNTLEQQKKAAAELEQIRESNRRLAEKVMPVVAATERYEANCNILAKTIRDMEALAVQIEELKTTGAELDAAQRYIKELEAAVAPIADTFVPEADDEPAQPLLERLKLIPDLAKSFVRKAAKVLITHMLIVVQNRWSNVEITKITEGPLEKCTQEEYDALSEKAAPVAEAIADSLDI